MGKTSEIIRKNLSSSIQYAFTVHFALAIALSSKSAFTQSHSLLPHSYSVQGSVTVRSAFAHRYSPFAHSASGKVEHLTVYTVHRRRNNGMGEGLAPLPTFFPKI